ncbi:hypothetical protein [Musicola paradisiaca]|uniref:Uncharacterized protein n=1 Tax=Musicola paradisiaca (strain Ech703) TaxID=579405 RepID=C6C666_MUSP7|nr:hypothetical protein [Musicola paradisiaca]ACS87675.1 hypothetical protein Dd703_3922 [Musicola paradisiaca Ech703]
MNKKQSIETEGVYFALIRREYTLPDQGNNLDKSSALMLAIRK